MQRDFNYYDEITHADKKSCEAEIEALVKECQKNVHKEKELQEIIFQYLSTDAEGRGLLEKLTKSRIHNLQKELEKKQHVLVILHKDGWVEVFSSQDIETHFHVMPDLEGPISEDVLMDLLPHALRAVYWPHATEKGPGKTNTVLVRTNEDGGYYWEGSSTTWLGNDIKEQKNAESE